MYYVIIIHANKGKKRKTNLTKHVTITVKYCLNCELNINLNQLDSK